MTLRSNRTRPSLRALMLVPIAALALSLAACGGAERPTAAQLADGLTEIFDEAGGAGIFTREQIVCIAEGLLDSNLSDGDLASLADGRDIRTNDDLDALTEELLPSCLMP